MLHGVTQLAGNFVRHSLSRECTVKRQCECSESEPNSEAVDQTAKQWAETRYKAEGSCWFMWSFSSSWATSFTLSYCLRVVIWFKVIFRPIWALFDETERRGKKKVGIEARSLLSIRPPYMGRSLFGPSIDYQLVQSDPAFCPMLAGMSSTPDGRVYLTATLKITILQTKTCDQFCLCISQSLSR